MVSKALDMSIDVVIVRLAGFLLLKPEQMVLFMLWRAVAVECCFLNPC